MKITLKRTWEDEDNGRNFDYEITGDLTEFIPARLYGAYEDCCPAEGGDFEDWIVKLTAAEYYSEDGFDIVKRLAEMTPAEIEAVTDEITNQLYNDDSLNEDARDEADDMTDSAMQEAADAKRKS